MRFAVAVLIGCFLTLGQNATSSDPGFGEKCLRRTTSPSVFVEVKPTSRIYFHVIRNESLILGPAIRSDGVVTVCMVGVKGKFNLRPEERRYTVTRTGVLVPKMGDFQGGTTGKVFKSKEPIFYVKGFKDILIPLNVLCAKPQQEKSEDADALARYMEEEKSDFSGESEVVSEEVKPRKMKKVQKELERIESGFVPKKDSQVEVIGRLVPDKNCNGEITMFILKSDGVFQRMPPDPYLPNGIKLSYTLKDNFLIHPRFVETSEESIVNFVTGANGDLVPHSKNKLRVTTDEGEFVAFILGECGSLIPVREERRPDDISYSYNGQVIYKGRQFPNVFSNSDFVMINNTKHKLPVKKKSHNIRKRSLYSEEFIESPPPSSRYYPPVRRTMVQELAPPRPSNLVQSIPVQQSVISRPTQTVIVRQPPSDGFISPPVRRINCEPPPPALGTALAPPGRVPPFVPEGISAEIQTGIPVRAPSRAPCGFSCGKPHESIPLPIPRREIPLQQVHVPVPEREIAVIPPTAVIEVPVTPPCKRCELYANDEKGDKILLEPEFTEHNDVVLYKLTCKGNLVRFPNCKEPEFGFPIHFKILLEEFIMVPVPDTDCGVHITYTLQENGDLVPCEANKNTFKKAPGSLLYFMLGRDNILFPVQQKVDPEGTVTYYYQDKYLLKLSSTANKPLHFSTFGRPLFAYYNGLTVMTTSSKPRLNSCRGSNWKNHCSSAGESESKDIFLAGPCGQLIRVTPFKTKSGTTVIYEMDNNGILYRSPKDKKRCIILKSYIVLKEGILLPSNETTGYMFMASKNGDMFPYLYPDGKLEAPQGESIKYLLCEKGILLPMELEIVNNQICYFFLDVIVYKEKVYTKADLDSLSDTSFKLHYRNECDEMAKRKEALSSSYSGQFKPFLSRDGSIVYYEKCDKLLKRHPADEVPKYLSYTMGSFEIQPDGSLFQIRYQDPDIDVINLMLEPNGDLMEDCRNVKKPSFNYYVLDVNGNLISVEARKTKKSIHFYKNSNKLCRVPLPRMNLIPDDELEVDNKKTPFGYDPLHLMDEPEPDNTDYGPMCIPVPVKSVALPEPGRCKEKSEGGKCEKKNGSEESEKSEENEGMCKETIALELEINDEVIEEIRNWANKCDKMLSRREVEESLTEALQGLSVAALYKDNTEAR